MNGGEAVIVCEMKDNNVENERRMRRLDLVFRSEVERNAILPFFELVIKLAYSIQKDAI